MTESAAISQEEIEAALAETVVETETPPQEEPAKPEEQEPVIPPAQPVPPALPARPLSVEELRAKLQVKPPSDIVDWINALIYADPGVGKTFFGGTADNDERTKPVLVLDIEGGVMTLRDKPGIDVKRIRSMKDMEQIHADLYHSIVDDAMYYKTILIDSLPELADIDMRLVMKQAYAKNPDTVDIDVPSPREWGKQRNHMRLIVRAFRDLPCNVIYTAQVGKVQEEGRPTKYHPNFAGKLQQEIPGFMDIVGYYIASVDPQTQQVTRTLQTLGTNRVVAKDRSQSLPPIVTNPTIPMLWDLIVSNPDAHKNLQDANAEIMEDLTTNDQ